MPNEFQYSVEDEKKFGVFLEDTRDLIRGYHKSMSKGKINDELKKREADDRERIYWEERAPKLLDDLDHKFRDTVWVDWVKNKHTNWLTELLKDSELVDYVPALKELKSFMKREEKAAAPPKAKKIKKKTNPIMRNYAIIAVAVLLLASVPWFFVVQSSQNNNDELENDVDIKVQEIAGLNARVSSLNSVNDDREKKNVVMQSDLSSKDREIEQLKNQFINLQNNFDQIICRNCVIELKLGTSSWEEPYNYGELTRWNEINGFIRGDFHEEVVYTVCVYLDTNIDVDEWSRDKVILITTTEAFDGEYEKHWDIGMSFFLIDHDIVSNHLLNLERSEDNVVEVLIFTELCHVTSSFIQSYMSEVDEEFISSYMTMYIKLPDGV